MMSGYKKGPHATDLAHDVVLEIAGSLQRLISNGQTFLSNQWNHYLYLVDVQEENRLLRKIISDLIEQRIRLEEVEIVNQRLKELLGFQESFPVPLVPASVIGEDISGWVQTIVIDRGEKDGIQEGMPVLCPSGVIGQVLESSPHFARVLLITDHSSEIAALTQRTRARGMIEGLGDRSCRLKYVHIFEDILPGDVVVSSGMDRIYPKGLMIGTVSRLDKEAYGLFQEAHVQPAVDFHKLEEVFVIVEKTESSP